MVRKAELVNLEPAAAALRDEFVGWQCRIRALAMREMEGRPSSGMRPRALGADGEEIAAAVTVIIQRRDPERSTQLFRFQFEKTLDPLERFEKAVDTLAAEYYQRPREFCDLLTGTFNAGSKILARLFEHPRCVLEFAQFSQGYRVPCTVSVLKSSDRYYQATYWHNALFNPHLPPDLVVAAFTPDWSHAARLTEV